MQAILLSTGESARLRPLTEAITAPMLPIANRPVMAYPLELLARSGFQDVRVCLHHLGGGIEAYFGDGARWGLHLDYRLQREPWGTAGAIQWAAGDLDETLLALPGDALVDLDIEAAIAFHRAHGREVTLILAESEEPAASPVRVQASDGRVTPDGAQVLCFTGACLLEPAAMEHIPARTPYDLYGHLLPALLANGMPVYGYRLAGYWNPLDSFADYQSAQLVMMHSAYTDEQPRLRFPYIEGRQVAPGIWVGRNPAIHPSARLAPPVCLGDDCRVGRGVELGPEAVIGHNVILDDEATVQRCTILPDTYLGRLVNVQNRVMHKTLMIDGTSGESVRVVDRHLAGETDPAAVSSGLRRAINGLGALALLALGLPLLAPLGLLILLATGGRLFRREPRLGRPPTDAGEGTRLRTFAMLHFQTQRANGALPRLGRWLERLEWDHLPALWNVLRGDLLLVGVKPLNPSEAAQVQEEWAQQRYQWPAGLTGLWYVQGQPGQMAALDDTLVADAYYTATRTWRDDLKLLARTPRAWLRRARSAFGRR